MDLSELEFLTEKQEQVISELEQELCDLLLEKEKLAGSEVEKLQTANEKLRYRVNILKVATARELSATAGDTGADNSEYFDDNTHDHISLDSGNNTKMTTDNEEQNDAIKNPNNETNDEVTRINNLLKSKNPNFPFVVENKEGVGNFVVASRDIKANEIILEDYPAALGPNYETEAVCLECLSRVDGSYLCSKCNLPLCGEQCTNGPMHLPECQVFSKLTKKIKVQTFGRGTIAYEYGCIAVIRLLWLRDNDVETWTRVQYLMDHDEDRRKETEYWNMFQRNVVDFMRKGLNLADTYTEEEIHRAVGILRTNAFQIEHPYLAAQGTSGKAVYPTFSFLSHSCISNARYIVHPDNRLTLRAMVDINKGEEVTIQYISFLFGNSKRCEDIKSCWFFQCGCPRCVSISELGTNLSAGLCQLPGCDGPVLPVDTSLDCQLWSCGQCGHQVDRDTVSDVVKELEAEMYETQEHEYDKYCALIDKYSKLLHPHHYQLLICKRFLAGSIRGNITVKLVEKRLQLMKEFISVFEKVDPGLSKWRGKMLYQVCKTRMFLCDVRNSANELNEKEFMKEISENIEGMKEVVECLEYEPENSNEWRMSQAAKVSIKQAEEVVKMVSSLIQC